MQPLAISAGDPSGIGYELIIKAWLAKNSQAIPDFIAVGDVSIFAEYALAYGLSINLHAITSEELANRDQLKAISKHSLAVLQVENPSLFSPAIAQNKNAPAIIESIKTATFLVHKKICSALVTCPISKSNLYSSGFTYPGHTEFLAELAQKFTGRSEPFIPVMLLKGRSLSTVPITIHTSLKRVPTLLNTKSIVTIGRIVNASLQKNFTIAKPRLAFAGLNPHAGEQGSMGQEEEIIIKPAISQLQTENILATGPFPADTLFHESARRNYDVAICMYHDQALIPIKTLEFETAVNVTLGLPFIRTSPDHGTAFNIAGQNKASATSLIEAIKLAAVMSQATEEAPCL